MKTEPVVVSESFDAPPARVWSAITDPRQMREWFFETMEDFKAEAGFETQFDVTCDGTVYRHCWTVKEVIPQQRIVYGWKYAGIPGESSVSWQLSNDGGATTLTLTHVETEPFPSDDPNFSKESCETGWKYFLQDRLASFLGRHEYHS